MIIEPAADISRSVRRSKRQNDIEDRSCRRSTFHTNPPVVRVNNSLGNRKSESRSHGALPCLCCAVKSLKDALAFGERDAPTLILHAHTDSLRDPRHPDRDGRPRHGVLHGIIDKLRQRDNDELGIHQCRNFFAFTDT